MAVHSVKAKAPIVIHFFFDYKSPFSYLALEGTRQLSERYFKVHQAPAAAVLASTNPEAEITVHWTPLHFSVEGGFGKPGERTEAQHHKTLYAYEDVRRFALARDIVIKGPLKAYDSSIALMGGLFAQRCGMASSDPEEAMKPFQRYTDFVFRSFFKREFDVSSRQHVETALREHGKLEDSDIAHFEDFCSPDGEGPALLRSIEADASKMRVFGVPSWSVHHEATPSTKLARMPALFFGQDRLPWLHRTIDQLLLANSQAKL